MPQTSFTVDLADSWRSLAKRAAERFGTPCFVCRHHLVEKQASRLQELAHGITLRQWLAVKCHPVSDVLHAWKAAGYGAEVVSPFELEAALETGYAPERILVNGVGKHAWLPRYNLRSLRVHFDSIAEIKALGAHAVANDWQLGFRYHPMVESDPDEPEYEDQFGFTNSELEAAAPLIRRLGLRLRGVHFHLRSNVTEVADFRLAIEESIRACSHLEMDPEYVDCGGGLPAAGESRSSWAQGLAPFDLDGYGQLLRTIPGLRPSIREVWVENGRFISSSSAVLVVRVLDVKERERSRYLICDGGRTNHALVSDWQQHQVLTVENRLGPTHLTTICGPTCMAYDRLARIELPRTVRAGDLLIWMNAGAYHIPWESRFSFGLAAVVTADQAGVLRLARSPESFTQWWRMWSKEPGA
ncbi:MAG: hypothetical protein IT430_11845 [Phycisphaerales bacterium]|nr:hypothetical protein [Phycisphaerales bacterium]